MTRDDPKQLDDLLTLRTAELRLAHAEWLEAERERLAVETRHRRLTETCLEIRDALQKRTHEIHQRCQHTFSIGELRPLRDTRRRLANLLEQREQELLTCTEQLSNAAEKATRQKTREQQLDVVVEALQAQRHERTRLRLKKRREREAEDLEYARSLKK